MRLIDADELLNKYSYDVTNFDEPYAVTIEHIKNAPTIPIYSIEDKRDIKVR